MIGANDEYEMIKDRDGQVGAPCEASIILKRRDKVKWWSKLIAVPLLLPKVRGLGEELLQVVYYLLRLLFHKYFP